VQKKPKFAQSFKQLQKIGLLEFQKICSLFIFTDRKEIFIIPAKKNGTARPVRLGTIEVSPK
jgi:hypothetical protein